MVEFGTLFTKMPFEGIHVVSTTNMGIGVSAEREKKCEEAQIKESDKIDAWFAFTLEKMDSAATSMCRGKRSSENNYVHFVAPRPPPSLVINASPWPRMEVKRFDEHLRVTHRMKVEAATVYDNGMIGLRVSDI